MKRRNGPPRPNQTIPNLAPMVDIIMVLLVFFLLGATLELTREGVLATQLDPRSGPGEGVPVQIIPAVQIALEAVDEGRACNLYVNGTPLAGNTADALRRFLAQRLAEGADATNPVVIGAEPGVQWRFVVRVMDASVRAGFKNVQFAVSLANPR